VTHARLSPAQDTMSAPPRDRSAPFFQTALLVRGLVWLGAYEAAVAMFCFFFHFWSHGYYGFSDLPSSGEVT
jgi:hypothetical protein